MEFVRKSSRSLPAKIVVGLVVATYFLAGPEVYEFLRGRCSNGSQHLASAEGHPAPPYQIFTLIMLVSHTRQHFDAKEYGEALEDVDAILQIDPTNAYGNAMRHILKDILASRTEQPQEK
jgi:hypothetical protein